MPAPRLEFRASRRNKKPRALTISIAEITLRRNGLFGIRCSRQLERLIRYLIGKGRKQELLPQGDAPRSDRSSLSPMLTEEISENPGSSGDRESLGGFAPTRMIVGTRNKQRYPHN